MSFADLDASYLSVDTSIPDHNVRFSIELHYFLKRELNNGSKPKVAKSTTDIKERLQKDALVNAPSAAAAAAAAATGESLPRYYVTYNIGTMYEGKSDILHPSNSFWSSSHDVEVSLEFLAELYEAPLEFKIWQVKKVWADDPTGSHALGSNPKNAMAVMSRQTLLFRRASINAIAKRLVTLSRTADTMSPRTRRKIDSFRSYVLHNYKQLPVAVRVLGTTVPPQRPLPLGGGGAPVKVPAAPHLAGASNPRTSLIRETISASASPSTSRASSAGSARHAAESGKQTEPPVSNNNNWNAHGRIGGGAAGGKGGNVTIASHPPEDLTGMCTFVRAKTPPHPHHFDEPNRTVPLIPDLPRRQRSLVDHHTHVGSIFVDVSFFFVGDIHAKSGLEGKVDGLQDAEVGVSLSAPLLTARQEESLNPLVITVQSVENLPDRPLSFEQLHRLCHPVYTRFAFLDQPASRHKARLSLIQQRNLRFDSRHVILTGLHDEDELRDFFLHSKLVVELHDRDKKGSGNDEKLALVQSFGVARFSLAELVAGATLLSMTASVVPSDSGAVLGAKHSIAPGFYLECDTLVKIKIESRCSIFGFGDTANNISRAVFVIPHSRFEMVERILELVQGTNIAALDLDSVEQLIETKMSKEQRRSTTLDMMTGFLVTDQGTSVLFLEGCIHIGMTRLLHLIESLDMEGITQYFDLQLSYSSRIWAGLSPNVAWIHLPKPLDELMREPRVFVRNKFPRPAFQALRNCQDIVRRTFATIFELSAHGLLPSLEQFEVLAGTDGMQSDLECVPISRLLALVPQRSFYSPSQLAAAAAKAAGTDRSAASSLRDPDIMGAKPRIHSHHPRSSPTYQWLVHHDRRDFGLIPPPDCMAANMAAHPGPSPPSRYVRARVPYGDQPSETKYLYSQQANNDREHIRLVNLVHAVNRAPDRVLVSSMRAAQPHAPAIEQDQVRLAPWIEQANRIGNAALATDGAAEWDKKREHETGAVPEAMTTEWFNKLEHRDQLGRPRVSVTPASFLPQ